MTIARAWSERDLGEAFFPVAMRPLYMPGTNEAKEFQRLKRHFAVVDLERRYPFSVVTDNYKLVTNEDAFKMAEKVMERVFHTTRMEDMICLNITMPLTRSFCHIDLVHKSSDFAPWQDDKWTAFLRITNSYNRTRLLRFEVGFCRWICLNGVIFGSKSVEFSNAHTRRGIDCIDRFADNIGDIRKLELEMTEKLHQLQRYYVPPQNMLALLCRVFDIKAPRSIITKSRRMDELRALCRQVMVLTDSYFNEMGPHGYAALNVLSDCATYPEGVIAPDISMHGLQQKVGSWMDEFITHIKSSDFSFESYLADYRETASVIASL